MNGEQVERHLRHHILGLLHVGRLKRGVPLPSIRGMAAKLGVDHRLVAAAYRTLEGEGLVEIRPGAGVFLASDVRAAALQDEVEGWLSGVLLEGRNRGIARAEVARLVERCAATPVRCACVESNDDHMVAVAAELEEGFSLDVMPVMVSPAAAAPVPADALAGADLVVTTVFHAASVRAAAAQAGTPLVVLRVEPRFAARVAQVLNAREVTAVIADPRFSARAAAYLEVTPQRGRVRFVLVDDVGADVDLRSESTLVTRAARRRLGLPEYHLIPSPPGYISSESAGELCQAIVGMNLTGATSKRGLAVEQSERIFERMNTTPLDEILRLSVDERFRMVQQIWDSIAAERSRPELTPAHRSEIRRRIDEYRRDPSIGIPAEEVFREIEESLG